MPKVERTWSIQDHICMTCGGRILRCEKGTGMSPGGNPLFMCSDCGKASWGFSPEDAGLCWCGYKHKNQSLSAYRCLAFSVLEKDPGLKPLFEACGCLPGRQEIGIVLEDSLRKYQAKKEIR